MSETNSNATSAETYGSNYGRIKWFNSKLGYGFVTTTIDNEETDIFVHQSNVKPNVSKYRTLREGEYVSLNVSTSGETTQAIDVTGVHGGPLLCDLSRNIHTSNTRHTREEEENTFTEVTSKKNRNRNNTKHTSQ